MIFWADPCFCLHTIVLAEADGGCLFVEIVCANVACWGN